MFCAVFVWNPVGPCVSLRLHASVVCTYTRLWRKYLLYTIAVYMTYNPNVRTLFPFVALSRSSV